MSGILSAIRTTLDIDDRLLDALMARSPGLSKTKAIERAIDHYVKEDVYESLRKLRGSRAQMVDFSIENRRLDIERQERAGPARA